MDIISYALGLSMAQQMQQSGVNTVEYDDMVEGIKDILERRQLKVPMQEAAVQLNQFINNSVNEMNRKNKEVSDAFMEGNKKQPDIITTESGLQYKSLGDNRSRGMFPTKDDMVEVHYTGKFLSGEVFNDTRSKGHTVTFALKDVIPGWTEGLQLLFEGEKTTFYVPYDLAYGAGGSDVIPPYSALIFDIELVKVIKQDNKEKEEKNEYKRIK